ncbi:MAG: pyruvate kinase, partial [Gammaproteobacteria bacterium]|nr:pyruvate kinase [Gammaproteobacteria bacterium]
MTRIDDIEGAIGRVREIDERCRKAEARYRVELADVHPNYRDSATNLVHYLALRGADIRDLQEILACCGLSSLDRAERNVMGSLRAVQFALVALAGSQHAMPDCESKALVLQNESAVANKEAILGSAPHGREVSIMVTLPRQAAGDYYIVKKMLAAGMNVARINCAHDDESAWAGMVKNVHAARKELGVDCRIVMDLAGPKIRTGELQPGPGVIHIRPRRDPLGRVIAPRRVRFIPDDTVWRGTKSAVVPVPAECIEYAHEGDQVRFKDTRGKKRTFTVVKKDEKGLVLEIYKGAYVASGTKLKLHRVAEGEKLSYRVGELQATEQPILLRRGDTLHLDRQPIPGSPAIEGNPGEITNPAHISCKQPEALDFVSAGQRISMNDGKIMGRIDAVNEDRLVATVTRARPTGS